MTRAYDLRAGPGCWAACLGLRVLCVPLGVLHLCLCAA